MFVSGKETNMIKDLKLDMYIMYTCLEYKKLLELE